jgi:citrate synthase
VRSCLALATACTDTLCKRVRLLLVYAGVKAKREKLFGFGHRMYGYTNRRAKMVWYCI